MSGRTVPRLLLVALLAAALAGPAVAQVHAEEEIFRPEGSLPAAPMPRAKANRAFIIELKFAWGEKPVAVAPMPRECRQHTTCPYDFGDLKALIYDASPVMPTPVPPELPVPPMTPPTPPAFAEAAPDFRFAVPQLGPLAQAFDIPLQPCPIDKRQVFNFSVGLFGPKQAQDSGSSCGFGSYCAPHLPRLVAPARVQPSAFVIGAGGFDLLPPPAPEQRHATVVQVIDFECSKACPANPLLGTWYRELPGTVIAATFTHDELKLCVACVSEGRIGAATITAHYTVTKDGLVFGAITSADTDCAKWGNSPFGASLPEIATWVQAITDAPFSFRTKMTSTGLMVSGLKSGTDTPTAFLDLFGGMYKPAKDGRVPTLVSVKTDRADKLVPATPDCQRVGIDFSTNNPPTMFPPQAPGSAVAPPCQPIQQIGGTKPNVMGGMTLPSGRYLEHFPQYFAPDPAFPLPRELASQEDPDGAARRGGPVLGGPAPQPVKPVGCGIPTDGTKQLATEAFGQLLQQSGVLPPLPALPVAAVGPVKGVAESRWCRDVAGKQCVLKLAPDHFTLTVIESHDENGKVSTASLIITADYHTTRDGVTAVGLITSVDVHFEGEFPQEDSKPFFEMLGELQKALEDKPFALTFRSYDDALVIGNVRMPSVSDRMEVQPAGYLAGRYTIVSDKLPKPKVLKISEPKAVPTGTQGLPYAVTPPAAPSIYAPAGTPGLTCPPLIRYPAAPPAPNSERLPPQAIPSPRIVPSSASEPVPSMTEPTPPVPQMPQPTPPPSSSSSEGLKQLYKEWRRFYFNDQPSHLTPERIHGGIY